MHDCSRTTFSTGLTSQERSTPRGKVGNPGNGAFLQELYQQWKANERSVDPSWAAFFEGFELGIQLPPEKRQKTTSSVEEVSSLQAFKLVYVDRLIEAYRAWGHLQAQLDPLGFNSPVAVELELSRFGLTEADLDQVFDVESVADLGVKKLRDILQLLQTTYSQHIGVEYTHLQDSEAKEWLRKEMEGCQNTPSYSKEKKKRILQKAQEAELFERFLHTHYVGQKRFSIEGGEACLSMLDALVELAPALKIEEFILGMAHRGRLTVLTNLVGKPYKDVFNEFAENDIPALKEGSGDVKYHMGYDSTVITTSSKPVRLSLVPNPSHLEAVNPVVEGKVRGRQFLLADQEAEKIVPILIHGDAAFIGQGVVAETLNLSQLPGYLTGGTLHIVINNQIGFTTTPSDGRSTTYCTAFAQALGAPIFHVNADDPEAAVYLIELAARFRQKFHQDAVVDLVCYRRYGHNEGDEPAFTQPLIYSKINSHPSVVQLYSQKLIQEGVLTAREIEAYQKEFNGKLQEQFDQSKAFAAKLKVALRKAISTPALLEVIPTSVESKKLKQIGDALCAEPSSIKLNPKMSALLKNRRMMIEGKESIDWGFGEALAFGSLLQEGVHVRLSGQDCRRGTFSHRHAVLYDVQTRDRYIPLENISPKQAPFHVYNSPLSEAGVLGFDFGYTLGSPQALVLWEAQFGDFANSAQTIIDQFIVSCESKWGLTSRLTMLLPHAYHGQGPEHSSARLERFLQACAEDNIQVAYCTTPASYFHLLRRQALRKVSKPLIVMTPKGLLRDKRATSSVQDFSKGSFEEVLPDAQAAQDTTRVILCSGKVYYDLAEHRKETKEKTALVRLEQLYPLHEKKLKEAVSAFSKAKKFVWCQEEPRNMGAWNFIEPQLREVFGRDWLYAGRPSSASPATGSHALHDVEQEALIHQAFEI